MIGTVMDLGLWGLVNNAGISEWSKIQVYLRHADVNLWGSIRMAETFIPLLRQSKGCLIFMSSMCAFIRMGDNSAYVISKCGIEALSDCLRLEMKKFGVKGKLPSFQVRQPGRENQRCLTKMHYSLQVSLIEPGNYASATNILKLQTCEEIWDGLNDAAKRAYSKEYIQLCIDYVQHITKGNPWNPMEVTNTIIEALVSPNPKARYLVVSMVERIIIFMCVHFPAWFTNAFFLYVGVHYRTKPWWLLK